MTILHEHKRKALWSTFTILLARHHGQGCKRESLETSVVIQNQREICKRVS